MASGAAALRYWERRQEISSNNLANVSTDGFKGQKVFARMVEGALPTADAVTDFSAGSVHQTGNPYDVAVEGNNFLVVGTQHGERLSRGGSLHVSLNGELTDGEGNPLLGENGPIRVAADGKQQVGDLTIGKTGIVKVDGTEVGRLRLEAVPPGASLERQGNGLFVPPAKRDRVAPDTVAVRQGALEDSNVSSISEMVDMIAIQRAYSAVQKAMSTIDTSRSIATSELGRPV